MQTIVGCAFSLSLHLLVTAFIISFPLTRSLNTRTHPPSPAFPSDVLFLSVSPIIPRVVVVIERNVPTKLSCIQSLNRSIDLSLQQKKVAASIVTGVTDTRGTPGPASADGLAAWNKETMSKYGLPDVEKPDAHVYKDADGYWVVKEVGRRVWGPGGGWRGRR